MSRDWTIDKITVGVAYDTDLAKVKALVKAIGVRPSMRAPPAGGGCLAPPV